jgi:transposase InsO family protein
MLYIAPRLPWANGYHASFNRSLRDDLPSGKIFFSLAEASGLIEVWRRYDHTARPRSGLGYRPPARKRRRGQCTDNQPGPLVAGHSIRARCTGA